MDITNMPISIPMNNPRIDFPFKISFLLNNNSLKIICMIILLVKARLNPDIIDEGLLKVELKKAARPVGTAVKMDKKILVNIPILLSLNRLPNIKPSGIPCSIITKAR